MQSKQKDKEFYFDNAVCGSTFKENVKKKRNWRHGIWGRSKGSRA